MERERSLRDIMGCVWTFARSVSLSCLAGHRLGIWPRTCTRILLFRKRSPVSGVSSCKMSCFHNISFSVPLLYLFTFFFVKSAFQFDEIALLTLPRGLCLQHEQRWWASRFKRSTLWSLRTCWKLKVQTGGENNVAREITGFPAHEGRHFGTDITFALLKFP